MSDYELRAAPGNPDQFRLTPEQLEQQAQVVGRWEQEKHIPDAELSGRYEKVMESKARDAQKRAEKKPIAEQLKEGAAEAAKYNTTHSAPVKNTEKDR